MAQRIFIMRNSLGLRAVGPLSGEVYSGRLPPASRIGDSPRGQWARGKLLVQVVDLLEGAEESIPGSWFTMQDLASRTH